jgi:hypothetical protein
MVILINSQVTIQILPYKKICVSRARVNFPPIVTPIKKYVFVKSQDFLMLFVEH